MVNRTTAMTIEEARAAIAAARAAAADNNGDNSEVAVPPPPPSAAAAGSSPLLSTGTSVNAADSKGSRDRSSTRSVTLTASAISADDVDTHIYTSTTATLSASAGVSNEAHDESKQTPVAAAGEVLIAEADDGAQLFSTG
jgi:hypothetical protein